MFKNEIKRKAKLHDEVTVKIMEIVNENNIKLAEIEKNQDLLRKIFNELVEKTDNINKKLGIK